MACSVERRLIHRNLIQTSLEANPTLTAKQYVKNNKVPLAERSDVTRIFNAVKTKVGGIDFVNLSLQSAWRTVTAMNFVSSRDAIKQTVRGIQRSGLRLSPEANVQEKITLDSVKAIENGIKAVDDFMFGRGNTGETVNRKSGNVQGWVGRVMDNLPFKQFDVHVKAKHAIEANERGKEAYDEWWGATELYLMNKFKNAKSPSTKKKVLKEVQEHNNIKTNYPVKGGFTTDQANEILRRPEYKGKEAIIEKLYKEFHENVNVRRVDNENRRGRMTDADANSVKNGLSRFDTKFDWYIPLEIDQDVLNAKTMNGRGAHSSSGRIRQRGVQGQLLWENDEIANPWATAVARFKASEYDFHRNETIKSVRNLVNEVGDTSVKIGKVPRNVKLDDRGNLISAKDVRSESRQKNSLYFTELVTDPDTKKQTAQRFYIEFTPNEEFEVHPFVQAFNQHPSNSIIFRDLRKPIQKVLSIMRGLITTKNPIFGPKNVFRDNQEILINIESIEADTGVKNLRRKFLKKVPSVMRDYTAVFFSRGTPEQLARIERFNKSGAPVSFAKVESFGREQTKIAKSLEELMNFEGDRDSVSYKKKFGSFLKNNWVERNEQLEAFNDIFELANRMALFETLIDAGIDEQKAAFEARTTADFLDKGLKAPDAGLLYLFYNAGVKGVERAWRTAKNPESLVKLGVALPVLGFTLQKISNAIDAEEECPTKFNQLKTKNNTLIPIGNCRFITIPKPYSVFRAPFELGEYVANTSDGLEEFDTFTAIGRFMTNVFESIDPIGFTDEGGGVVPTLARPVSQVISNKNWAGSDIVPGYFADDKFTPFNEKSWDSDSEVAKAISNQLGRVEAIQASNPNALSPIALDYVFNAYFNIGVISELNKFFFKDKASAVKEVDGEEVVTGVDNLVEWIVESLAGNEVISTRKLETPEDYLIEAINLSKKDPLIRSFYSDRETEDRALRFSIEKLVNTTPADNLTERQYQFILDNIDKVELKSRRLTQLKNDIQRKFNDKIEELDMPRIGKRPKK